MVNPPSVTEKYVDIPGRDGRLDITELLTGAAVYGDRTGSWEFYIDHDHISNYKWQNLYTNVMGFLHGKWVTVVLEDDPDYRYYGRTRVSAFKADKNHSMITIDYVLEPYKQHVEDGSADSGVYKL